MGDDQMSLKKRFAQLQKTLDKMDERQNLEQLIDKQLKERDHKIVKRYFLNELAHKFMVKKGLIPHNKENKLKNILQQFNSVNTFVNMKQLMHDINLLNSGSSFRQILSIYEITNMKINQGQIYNTIRNIDLIDLPEFIHNSYLYQRINKLKKDIDKAGLHSHSLNKLQSTFSQNDDFFHNSLVDQENQSLKFYEDLFASLQLVKEEENTNDQQLQIAKSLQSRIKQYKQKLEQQQQANNNPQAYYSQYKRKANLVQSKIGKILENIIDTKYSKGQAKKKIKLGKLVAYKKQHHSLQKHNRPFQKDKSPPVKPPRVREFVLKRIDNLITLIENDKFVFKKEKDVLMNLINRISKSQTEQLQAYNDMHALKLQSKIMPRSYVIKKRRR